MNILFPQLSTTHSMITHPKNESALDSKKFGREMKFRQKARASITRDF